MRIMLDTNILISMLLFPNEQFRKILDYITRNHKLVLSSFIIDELIAVVARKFPKKRYAVDSFYRTCHTSLFTRLVICQEIFWYQRYKWSSSTLYRHYWKYRYLHYRWQRFFGCRDWNARDYDAGRVFRKSYKKS